jgi:hypothetical protein
VNSIRPHPGQQAIRGLRDVEHGLVVHQTRNDDIGRRYGFLDGRFGARAQRN